MHRLFRAEKSGDTLFLAGHGFGLGFFRQPGKQQTIRVVLLTEQQHDLV